MENFIEIIKLKGFIEQESRITSWRHNEQLEEGIFVKGYEDNIIIEIAIKTTIFMGNFIYSDPTIVFTGTHYLEKKSRIKIYESLDTFNRIKNIDLVDKIINDILYMLNKDGE